ncbi:MAG: class I SAM-dependent methyltransferase [Chloroflexi bacterium]|nr:MAG: class I SAM-dependent methyltransferase [Chloroflexota bacterium]
MTLTVGSAAERWARELARWRIPDDILAKAPEDPWRIPPALFAVEAESTLSPSHRRALEALPAAGTVLDVGAGGGAMSRPLRERASRITAVDTSAAMLAQCDADVRLEGRWPDVASAAGVADVVACGHVVYNVADIDPFIAALTAAARSRVVLEFTAVHPLHNPVERELWRTVWGVERPDGPRAADLLSVLTEMGIAAHEERWTRERGDSPERFAARVTLVRRHLCLPVEREPEVGAALRRAPARPRELVTAWWDV